MSNIDPSLVIPYFKRVGQTPLDCVEEYRVRTSLSSSEIISYAGRLDPMAEGVLLLLRGEANKRRRHFEHLSKQYEVMVLCGFVTDTGDLMGIVSGVQSAEYPLTLLKTGSVSSRKKQSFWSEAIESEKKILSSPPDGGSPRMTNLSKVRKILPSFIGLIEQKYPIFSSRKVRGKALYWWTRQGRLSEIAVPNHKVQIDAIELISENSITDELLLKYIVESVGSVKGDFRQEEIIKQWKDKLSVSTSSLRETNNTKNQDPSLHTLFILRIDCGSGVYMRQLVQDLGDKLLVPMCAYSIRRTRVGDFSISDCMNAHEPQASTAF